MAARTVLGPKPCSTQAPTVLDVDVLVPSVSMCDRCSLLGLENLPEQTPQKLQIVQSDLVK